MKIHHQRSIKLFLLGMLCLLALGVSLLRTERGLKHNAASDLRNKRGVQLIPATYEQKETIQNLSRFYAYDMSKPCGHEPNWEFPPNGLYTAHPVETYWHDPSRHPFIIAINGKLGGFVLVNKVGSTADVDWNIAEFFITGNFQIKGMGKKVAFEIFEHFPGSIEIMILPCNQPALSFWRKVVHDYTKGQFTETRKEIPHRNPADTIILKFKS